MHFLKQGRMGFQVQEGDTTRSSSNRTRIKMAAESMTPKPIYAKEADVTL